MSADSPKTHAPLAIPIALSEWIQKYGENYLKPPVSNFVIQKGSQFNVMLVGGPNERSDYHINPTEEWFHQLQGDLLLRLVEEKSNGEPSVFRDQWVRQGEMFLLAAHTPHNPVRFANTLGLVLEVSRPQGQMDALRWYCKKCRVQVYEERFQCVDLGVQLVPVIERWRSSEERRTCRNCGHLNDPQ